MSHDTDKLIRQLSLVAFLMAERRPLTARDVKQNVEGYQEMSDEAFARRFYSDRAELIALGVPLHSQRDEFTGEELYTLSSEQYFLPELQLEDEELAALQTALYLLEGKFAYAEPLRLALQNLALGRVGFDERPTETALRVEVLDPDYSPEMSGRLGKLESAISKQRTVKFRYWSISTDKHAERTLNPYGLYPDRGSWYVVGQDLDRNALRTFKLSRIEGDIRFATRRERDFRLPEEFDVDEFRGRPDWQIGDAVGEARIEMAPDTAWWVERAYGERGHFEDDVFVTPYSTVRALASWVLRQDGRAKPIEPEELRRSVAGALRRVRDAHESKPPEPAPAPRARARGDDDGERPAGPVVPERFGVLQALLAYLLARCGDRRDAEIPAHELVEKFHIPYDQLQEHLSLLSLVNFGGGCYAVYAELKDDVVRVDKELYGDTFRLPPRLTPLEARAITLALEFVGPMIAAEAHSPLERVRQKLADTFGEFGSATAEPEAHTDEEELVATLSRAMRERKLVEIEYQKEGEETWSRRLVEPYTMERKLPNWIVHTWDRTVEDERSFRLDRMRNAKLTRERFDARPGFDPAGLRNARTARVWYSPAVARFKVERGATLLRDGAAVGELRFGSDEWLVAEILADLGEAVVLEPAELRPAIARRARELAQQFGVARLRVGAES